MSNPVTVHVDFHAQPDKAQALREWRERNRRGSFFYEPSWMMRPGTKVYRSEHLEAIFVKIVGLQLVPGLETVEASYVPPANLEYNRLRLGNNAGVASASLSKSVRVSRACVSD